MTGVYSTGTLRLFAVTGPPWASSQKKVGKGVKTGTGVYFTGSLRQRKWERGINT
ncbi:hypothetical protein [Cyanophage S-TIM61]|nr:hypothetical protein [Cyanophage S-TIM66]UYE96957.1 hypothetical protein [Cyanophage S-TIM61]